MEINSELSGRGIVYNSCKLESQLRSFSINGHVQVI